LVIFSSLQEVVARKQALRTVTSFGDARIERLFTGRRLQNPAEETSHKITGGGILRPLSFVSNLLVNGHLATSFLIFVLMLVRR
jgi:hypothetical protein